MSSFIESLIGNAAAQGEATVKDWRLRDQKLSDEQRAHDMAIERQRAVDQLRLDMAERQRQDKQTRVQGQISQAEALASRQRESDLTEAGVGDVSTLTPEQERMIAKHRGLDYGNPLSSLNGQLKAARGAGLYDAAEVLAAERKETVAALQAEYKRVYDERRQDAIEKKNDNQHAEAMARIAARERKGSGSSDSLEKLTARKQAALRAMTMYQAAGVDKTDPAYAAEAAELEEVNALLAAQNPKRGSKTPVADEKPTKTLNFNLKTGKFE